MDSYLTRITLMNYAPKHLPLIIFLESFLVLSLALYMIALGFTHDKEWPPYLGVIAFALIGSAGLFFLARGIKESKRWAISPAILANLIALGVAYYQIQGSFYIGATVILCCAVPALIGLFSLAKNAGE